MFSLKNKEEYLKFIEPYFNKFKFNFMPISKTVYLWENDYFKENPLNSLESNRVYEDDIIKLVNVENPSMDIFEVTISF